VIGTALNVGTVVLGAVAGRAVGARLPERIRESVMHVIGLVTLVIGLGMVTRSSEPLVLLFSLVLGAVIGELLRIEAGIERLGAIAEQRFTGRAEGGDFVRGFVTTSILFCVGPVTILGCLQDGLTGDYRLLAVKATMDGICALAFASALGWGVLLSAVTVLVVQGGLTLGARSLEPFLRDQAVQNELFAVGGVMMLALALGLLDLKQIRVANLLPALLLAPLLMPLAALLPR
jgi:uncharacterized membrane protein YqgA involved in biofilm formation